MRSRLRTYFIAGLIVFLPVAVTISILLWLFRILDGFLGALFALVLGRPVPGLGLVASILVILLTGALVTNVLGRRIVGWFERLMLRIPLARSIYSATKAISDSIFSKRKAAFQRPVLIEWPRRGVYTVGFLTGESAGDAAAAAGRRVFNVFVVTTPNPTTGFLVLVPEDQVLPLDMSVEDALKLVMSGGIVSPAAPGTRPPAEMSGRPAGGPV